MWTLSPKQIDFVKNGDHKYNFAIGSVRSGKTVASNVAFMKFCASKDVDGPFIILGRTEASIRNNILTPFADYLGSHFNYRAGNRILHLAGREIHVVGASDLKAEARIRGATYAGALVDEVTVIPEPVFRQLTYRLSVRGARMYGTTNPDSPYHWFKKGYIDREGDPDMDVKVWNFNFSDNPSLDESYIRKIKAESHGLWYKRFVEGLWVLAEGAVYDFFDEKLHIIPHAPNRAMEYVVGIDYGTTNPCAFALIGYNPETFPKLWLEKEYYYDSKKANRQKTDSEYSEDLAKFIEGYGIKGVYVDPSAASFKAEMMRIGIPNVIDANNDVINGIRCVGEYLNGGAFKVCEGSTNAIMEFSNYIWDVHAAQRGIEKPLKQNDHMLDAIRYVLHSRYADLGRSPLTQTMIDRMRGEAMGYQPNLPPFFANTQYSCR